MKFKGIEVDDEKMVCFIIVLCLSAFALLYFCTSDIDNRRGNDIKDGIDNSKTINSQLQDGLAKDQDRVAKSVERLGNAENELDRAENSIRRCEQILDRASKRTQEASEKVK